MHNKKKAVQFNERPFSHINTVNVNTVPLRGLLPMPVTRLE